MHTNKIDNKKYIGLTKQKPESRWGANGGNYESSPYFYSAIRKHGWNNFDHHVIHSGMTKKDACLLERHYIKYYKTQNKNYGYNILEGGDAPECPEEIRKKRSVSMIGNKNGLGKPCSEEKKRKISEAQKGKRLTDEHRKALSEAKRGKPRNPLSEETKKKISDSHSKTPIICVETGVIYDSIHACAKELGVSATAICAVCKGRHKSTGGYCFKYL